MREEKALESPGKSLELFLLKTVATQLSSDAVSK